MDIDGSRMVISMICAYCRNQSSQDPNYVCGMLHTFQTRGETVDGFYTQCTQCNFFNGRFATQSESMSYLCNCNFHYIWNREFLKPDFLPIICKQD